MKNYELLAPAGNMDAALQAIHNGADAIYIGGKNFGARAFAANFFYDEMKQAIDTAHLYGVRVYITVNTLIYQSETADFLQHVQKIYMLGADALIMQDVGMIDMVRNSFPDIEIHASTQMHNHNDSCLYFDKELGMTRAVLARETSLEQIKNLTCDIQKEVFIHGALCISYSGQCLFSSLTLGRSGNRGTCAQACRMRYTLEDEDGHIVQKDGEYLLSPKDLALFEDIGKLADLDVAGFKIEGRMKSPQYVGHATKIYAKLLNSYKNNNPMHVSASDADILERLFNRGFTKGHVMGDSGASLMQPLRPNHKGSPLGRVKSFNRDKIVIELNNTLNQGDGIKFDTSDTGFICNKIYLNGKLVNGANVGDTIEVDAKARVQAGETVLKTSDVKLMKSLDDYAQKKIAVSAHIKAIKSQPLQLTLNDDNGNEVRVQGDTVQSSRTRPTTEPELIDSISKLGGTPFMMEHVSCECDLDIFIAKSQVNAIRRAAVDELYASRTAIAERRIIDYVPEPVSYTVQDGGTKLHVLIRTAEQFEAIKDIVSGDIYTSDETLYRTYKSEYKNLRLKTNKLAEYAPEYNGERLLITDNGGMYDYKNGNDIVCDYSLNVVNAQTASVFVGMNASRVALSPELSITHTADLLQAYKQNNAQKPPFEAIVYARYELIAMKHCIISDSSKTDKRCAKCDKKQYYLKDIHENRYPVVTDNSCNNYILGPLVESHDIAILKALGIRHFRIEFFDESAKQSLEITKNYLSKISG